MMERSFDERLALARRAAARLYAYGARRVWVFGSLARARPQDRRSDIDLAVEGLAPSVRQQASREAIRLTGGRVDILLLESMPPHLRWSVMDRRQLLDPSAEVADAGCEADGHELDDAAGGLRSLYRDRLDAALNVLRRSGARRVLDFGCGHCWLVESLARDEVIVRVTGVDRSETALEAADRRLARRLNPQQRGRIRLVRDLITRRNPLFLGHDAVVALEVIEHLADAPRSAFEGVTFDYCQPRIVIVTTPNIEYNERWPIRTRNGLRHEEHRFEWTRAQFRAWGDALAGRYPYDVLFLPVGPFHATSGSPTQMAVFTRREG